MSSSTSVPPAVRATSSLVPPSSRPLRAARRRALGARAGWRLRPLSQALAVLALAGGWSGAAHAQARAFSSSWFADKNAVQSTAQRTGRMPDGSLAGIGTSARQQAEARQQLRHSLDNLNRTAAAVAAQQAAQAAARAAAAANGGGVPDGLVEGGLWEARGALARWEGAKAAKTSTEGGRQVVTIEQTQSRAILNWDTFNVGRDTTLRFQQNSSDAVLNRVVGASAKPSEIHGAIKADGTVLVVNQNGVIFTGTSQVNARNLVAAAATITDAQFRDKGLYADADGTQPTFKDALGQVRVLAGARIETAAPASATQGGGYVLLLGGEVHNAGAIHTPRGQAALAAGDDFYIRKGYGTDVNLRSTTQGNEVSTAIKAGSGAGLVSNTGLITAPTGDITLTGRTVRQDGVLLATTDIGARGAIHLLNRAGDANGSITLGAGSVTAVLLEASAVTGLDGQRDAAIKALDGGIVNKTGGVFDNLSSVSDRGDLSRIEVVTGNLATFAGGSTTVATGGRSPCRPRPAACWKAARSWTWPAPSACAWRWKPTTWPSTSRATNSATPRSTATASCSTAATSGSTAARWCAWRRGQRLLLRPLVHRRRPAGGERLPGHQRPQRRRVAGAGRHRHLHRRRTDDAGRLQHQPVGRHARRAGRLHPPELAARRRRPPVRRLARARRPALHRPVQGLRANACALGRKGHAHLLQPADRSARAV
ncbi:filamentous hemagglutinin N-terminal domain-containing protein [Achromobacter insuavis]